MSTARAHMGGGLCSGLVSAAMGVLGCGGTTAATPLTYVTAYSAGAAPDASPQLPSPNYAALTPAHVVTFKALHAEVTEVVASETMRAYLEDIDAVLSRSRVLPLSGRRLAAIYLGMDSQYPALPLCYSFKSGGWSETAATSVGPTPSVCGPTGTNGANLTLRSVTLERANSAVRETKSCAINTLAHEWSHSMVSSTGEGNGLEMLFQDDGHAKQSGPLASYVVGAVAQCVYLARTAQGAGFDVKGCVEAVGTNSFDTASCSAGWAKRFECTVGAPGCV